MGCGAYEMDLLQDELTGFRQREAVYLHVVREVAFRIGDDLLMELSPPVRSLLIDIRTDGLTNGLNAFYSARN